MVPGASTRGECSASTGANFVGIPVDVARYIVITVGVVNPLRSAPPSSGAAM